MTTVPLGRGPEQPPLTVCELAAPAAATVTPVVAGEARPAVVITTAVLPMKPPTKAITAMPRLVR